MRLKVQANIPGLYSRAYSGEGRTISFSGLACLRLCPRPGAQSTPSAVLLDSPLTRNLTNPESRAD